jgi:hypothetical protein
MKSLFTSILLTLSVTTFAQIPSYVPSNGLVGWWPFNGNANDESGNGNNGTVNGATLTADRFGNSNASYYFANNKIEVPHNSSLGIQQFQGFSVSVWAKKNPGVLTTHLMGKRPSGAQNFNWHIADWEGAQFSSTSAPYVFGAITMIPVDTSNWMHIVGVYNNGTWSIFLNGTLTLSNTVPYFHPDVNIPLVFGNSGDWGGFMGKLDDIGIWNRALTQQEITALYNGCQLAVNTQPANQTININNNAQFIVSSSDTNATYQWQTDLGVGFQNVSNAGQYNGASNDTLSVANVSMSNNNQSFRCIINSGSCADTSNVAVLTINNNVGIHEMAQHNLFSVFPNPAHNIINVKADHKLIGSVFTIYDNTGKAVQSGKINAANTSIELSNLSSGFYMFSVGENRKQSFKIIKE